jgi:hypothetical protein
MSKGKGKGKGERGDWFQLPDEDEKALADLVEKHGMTGVLAVLSRLSLQRDRWTKMGKKAAQEAVDSLG